MCTRGLGDCTPYFTTCTIVVRPHTSPHSSLTARAATSSRHDHRPSSDRSKSTSPIGPPDLSAEAPTISKCRSEPPKIRPFLPSERQPLSTFSPHSHSSSSTSIIPLSPTPYHPRRGPRLVPSLCDFVALDVSGVRGDGYEDGEELTRAQVRN